MALHKKIPLTKGGFFTVDSEDFPVLSRFTWRLDEDGKPVTSLTRDDGYTPRPISVVKFLLKGKIKSRVHFIDGNTLNCSKSNLELRTSTELIHKAKKQMLRGGKKCTSIYKGVYLTKKGIWFGVIHKKVLGEGLKRNLRRIVVYRGNSEKKAAEAYNKKARELYGEFAYQNEI